MTSSEESARQQKQSYRIERSPMDCVTHPSSRGWGDASHQCPRADSWSLRDRLLRGDFRPAPNFICVLIPRPYAPSSPLCSTWTTASASDAGGDKSVPATSIACLQAPSPEMITAVSDIARSREHVSSIKYWWYHHPLPTPYSLSLSHYLRASCAPQCTWRGVSSPGDGDGAPSIL